MATLIPSLGSCVSRMTSGERRLAVTRTMVTLIGMRKQFANFETIHMAAHWDHDGTQMAQAIQRTVARAVNRHGIFRIVGIPKSR